MNVYRENIIIRNEFLKKNFIFVVLFLMVIVSPFYSCIDEFSVEVDDYENLLVVDGIITNRSEPVEVNLSLSSQSNNPEYIPYPGCEVSIFDNSGDVIELIETTEGTYVSVESDFGVTGMSYKIKIIIPSGKHYESEFEVLKPATEIDSVYAVVESKLAPNINYELNGYQFYINTKNAQDENTYYLWRLEQTYKFNSDFMIYKYYNGEMHLFEPTDSLYTCWKTDKINDIFVYGTAGLTNPNLIQYPLNYVSTEERELSIRYSLLIHQYTIGEKAYNFWNDVYTQNSGEATLYTQQLYQIRGNVKNISDELEPVLGYFNVAGVDSRRIFVNRPTGVDFNYSICVIGDGDYDAYKYIRWTDKRTWPLYVCVDNNYRSALPQQICLDCRQKGGTIAKPEYWIDIR